MAFLFPEFLFAWLLLAIPIFIHLFNFRKFKKVVFTNVAFLKEIQTQTSSARKLKDRLILLMRLLAVFFLVLAFAQPYLINEGEAGTFQKNVVSFYLDNSYSMEALNKDGSLLDEGKRKIKEVANAYGINDRFHLVTNDFEGKHQRLLSKQELFDELDKVKIAALSKSYRQILQRQAQILNKEQGVRKSAYLFSDFQQQVNNSEEIKPDSDIFLYAAPLKANAIANISIDTAYFLTPIHKPGDRELLVVRLKNHADEAAMQIPLKLTINGVQKAQSAYNIPPQGYQTDTLSFSGLTPGWQKAELKIKDYPIIFDDDLKFTFEVKKELLVLGLYQDAAVKPISYAYQTDRFFRFEEKNQSQLNYAALSQYQLIVLENLQVISDGLAQQLKQFVDNGGNLSVFIPAEADLTSYQTALKNIGTNFPISFNKEAIRSIAMYSKHPFFKDLFEQIPKNLDLPAASGYFKSSKLSRTNKQTLISGQGDNPIFDSYSMNSGNVFIWWIPIDEEFSNLSRHALFLPSLFKMALSGKQEQPLFYTLGKATSLQIKSLNVAESEIVKIKDKDFELIPEIRQRNGGSTLFFDDQIKQSGFYEVIFKNQLVQQLAFNESRDESVQKFFNRNELQDIFGLTSDEIFDGSSAYITKNIQQDNLGSSLWKLCLILSILFLLGEILLIRFYKKSVKSP